MDVQRIRIGSYNVKDFIAPSQGNGIREAKSNAELRALADTLKEADCDIVSMQEVGSKKLLEKFSQERLGGVYPHVALVPSNDPSGLNLALISKWPILKVTSHKNDRIPTADGLGTTQFTRDFLRIDLSVNGEVVTVYNTHGKAYLGKSETREQREAEGAAGREIVLADMAPYPNRFFAVTGDFNDDTHSSSVRRLAEGDGRGAQLRDSLEGKPREEQLTWIKPSMNTYEVQGHQYDHVLYPVSQKDKFVGSRVHSQGKNADLASDHYLVSADFLIARPGP